MIVEQQRQEWLNRLRTLVESIDAWAGELGWSTRRIEKSMHDSLIGNYIAPALLLQHETCRVLLEPITHSAPGADGIVDLYQMPAYDDVATLVFDQGNWSIRGTSQDGIGNDAPEWKSLPLTRETLAAVLQDLIEHAAAV